MKKFDLSKYPSLPGCYLYEDKEGTIIYVGKAKDLRKRISSYFNKTEKDDKTKSLIEKVNLINFIVTNSEIEAFILEDSLIKKYKPKYNIDLKDSKSYAYIEITQEKFPRLIIARADLVKKRKEKIEIYGPFTSAESRNQLLDIINKTFKLRTCKKLPKKKCLRYDLGICSAPCIDKIAPEKYSLDIEGAIMVLKGKDKELLNELKETMKKQSASQKYESALETKSKINSLLYLREKQNVERNKKYNEDIINYLIDKDLVYITVFNILHGTLLNKQDFIFNHSKDFFEEFILRFYSENSLPKELILPKNISNVLKSFLEKKASHSINVKIPKKGELKQLLDLVKKNIELSYFGDLVALEELKKILNLNEIPKIIECFDISHLGGTEVVASMVQFRNGKPDKTNYRKYKIKSFQGNDDTRAMAEVVKRRYKKLKDDKLNFPNLIIVDGGMGQLNAALNSLNELGLKIPIISLAKKFEEIYIPGKNLPISLPEKNKARLLLQTARDEAHRFAINFQRKRRKIFSFE